MKKQVYGKAVQYHNDGDSLIQIMNMEQWLPNLMMTIKDGSLYLLKPGSTTMTDDNVINRIDENDYIIRMDYGSYHIMNEETFKRTYREVDHNGYNVMETIDLIQFDGTQDSVRAITNLDWNQYYEFGIPIKLNQLIVDCSDEYGNHWQEPTTVSVSDYVIHTANRQFAKLTPAKITDLYGDLKTMKAGQGA